MSYYSNRNGVSPGEINGSPMEGLRTRVAISATRILDSCKKQLSLECQKLALKGVLVGEKPLTFVSAQSTEIKAKVTDLCVARLEERPCFARIKCTVTIPLQVTYVDANGENHCTTSEIKVPEDIVMYVPEASVFPFEIVAVASCNCPNGKIDGEKCCTVTACLTIITKVVAETDLLIPAYGYCPTPNAIDFEEQACNKFFELPLYPCGK